MKAVILNADRKHELVAVDDPTPGPGQVLIRSRFCGICGSDLHAPELPDLFQTDVIAGHEFAGEIVAIGPGAEGWAVGQTVTANPNGRVCHQCRYCREGRYNLCHVGTYDNPLGVAVHGGMAEYVAVDTAYLHALPEGLDTRRAAWTEPLAVAVRAVRTSPLRLGDTAAVIGGGPVGQLAVQLLRRAGGRRVVMVEPSAFRRQTALTLGADEALTPTELADRLASVEFAEIDHVLECSGHPSAVQTGLSMVAAGGSIRLVGISPTPPAFDAMAFVTKEVQLLGRFIYVQEFATAIELLAAGMVDVDTLTTSTTPLENFADAFEALRQPEQSMKVLIQP